MASNRSIVESTWTLEVDQARSKAQDFMAYVVSAERV